MLRGMGGTLIALPFLEYFSSSASAQAIPKRFAIFCGGVALPNLEDVIPDASGHGFDLKRGLASLRDYESLMPYTTLVSGMKIPWQPAGSGSIPKAGRDRDFHGSSLGPLLSGARGIENQGYGSSAPTIDQLIAKDIAGDTAFKSIEYRVQKEHYRGGSDRSGGLMSWELRDGKMQPRLPLVSPRTAFDSLFTGFSPVDPEEAARRKYELDKDRSILDLVRSRASRLENELGMEDKHRLQRHFDEIRDLERRLQSIPDEPIGACMLPSRPGQDPSTVIEVGTDERNNGWSREDLRADALVDLMHMAFACDRTRVASCLISFFQSFMSAKHMGGGRSDVHETSHGGGAKFEGLANAYSWHVGIAARLAEKLRNTPEGDGNLLDHTAVIYVSEGGRGYDPAAPSRKMSVHSTENMIALVIGHAGRLRGQGHIIREGEHPSSVLLTTAQEAGYQSDSLNEVDRGIDALKG